MPLDFSTGHRPMTTFSLAGLTDIVLLLLVFFLLTSNFVPQLGIQVNLPEANASSPADTQFITVSITDQGTFFVGRREVSQNNLMPALREARDGRKSLLLRADQKATVRQFAAVATAAQALNLRVLMATKQAKEWTVSGGSVDGGE